MATSLTFKSTLDYLEWRPAAPALTAATVGVSLAFDKRNNKDRDPYIYQLAAATTLNIYHTLNDGWNILSTPGLGGTFGAGACAKFSPCAGPAGTIGTGNTTTMVTITTALTTAIAPNQWANRGDGQGYKIRIVGNSAGGSGKIEERYIVANAGGATTNVYVDQAFSFTPAVGDRYELLSGKVYLMCAGAQAAGLFKSYDVATNSYATLGTGNLPATISTDSSMVCYDELFVPCNRNPGDGFYGILVATASGTSALTGQTSTGDYDTTVNQWRNFQLRIVEDTGTPTAVGQRRLISSHTVGPNPIYATIGTWAVQPSSTCSYVIENNNNLLLWTSASTATYNYTVGGYAADGTWSISTATGTNSNLRFATRPSAMGAGCVSFPSWGLASLGTGNVAKYSYAYSFRGGNVTQLDVLDLAGGATGCWESSVVYAGASSSILITTGTCGKYDSATNLGKYGYLCLNGLSRFYRFDVMNRTLEPYVLWRVAQSTATVGDKVALKLFVDPDDNTKLSSLFTMQQAGTLWYSVENER